MRRNEDTRQIIIIWRENTNSEKGIEIWNIGEIPIEIYTKQVWTDSLNET